MVSEKQLEANRRNAQASTGPRTEDGKAASSKNAVTHGMTAAPGFVLPTEDKEEHDSFVQRMLEEFAPVGAVEEELANQIVNLMWRLRRDDAVEAGILARGIAAEDKEFFLGERNKCALTYAQMRRLELDLDGTRVHTMGDAIKYFEFQDLADQTALAYRTDEARLAGAFTSDASGPNALSKLARYQTSHFNMFNKLFEQLTTLQTARKSAGE